MHYYCLVKDGEILTAYDIASSLQIPRLYTSRDVADVIAHDLSDFHDIHIEVKKCRIEIIDKE